MAGRNIGFFCLLLVVLACTLSGACLALSVDRNEVDTQLRHRRSLLAAKPQQISQCEWISGEGCALHPSYVTFALNKTRNDVVAGYVARALACAGVVEKGACEGVSYCFWDSSFTNGQQGCFLHESAMLSLQQQCIRPASRGSLEKLQSCMEERHSCQCNGGAASSACQMRQQQLLASYSTSSSKVCQSLLGCWLSKLNNSSPDVMQLVEVQLALVQPRMESLIPRSLNVPASSSSSSTLTGRRRSLQQNLPSLSAPILNDKITSSTAGSNSLGQLESGSLQLESGSLVPGIPEPEGTTQPASSPPASAVGMNGGIWNDQEASSPTGAPVEGGKGIPGPTQSSPDLQLESGSMPGDGWNVEQGTPVDPDQVFGNNGTSSTNSSNSGDNSGEVQMTGGNAPASFWKCVGTAAIKADTTRKWADVDYNSKALTLATWIRVIQPTALIDWGVQVMECFKADVTTLPLSTASPDKANKESMEYAIVALIRVFSAEADAFRAYLQAGQNSRATAGMAGLKTLSSQVFPDQLRNLQNTYNKTAAYDRDVMLQAAALIADMQWFITDAVALSSTAGGSSAQQQQVFEAVVSYGEDMMRRCLYWLFHVQFAGPPAHLPGVPTTHAASTAVIDAFDGLAAAALPAQAVAADAPAWQQVQGMMAVAAGWAANAAAVAKPANGQLDAAVQLGNAIDGLAKAHLQDFWGTRVELARAAAPESSRQLALLDPTQQSAGYQPLRDQQLQLFAALQQHIAAGDAASAASYAQVNQKLRDVVAASGSFLQGGSSNAQLADALQYSTWLAGLIRQCRGSPAGLRPPSAVATAAAGVPATAAAACNQLTAEADRMAAAALAGTSSTADAVRSNLADNIKKQWSCAANDPDKCSSVPGCQLALLGTVVPGTTTAGSSASVAANAELLLQGTAASGLQFACQADDAGLLLSSYPTASKANLGVSPACQVFLELPACEAIEQAGSCDANAACRWELTSERNLLHTAGNLSGSAAAAKVAKNSTKGVCAMDWAEVLSSGSSTAYSSLQSMISVCSDISDVAACTAQTMMITLDTSQGSSSNIARVWVPALVVAAVLGLLLFGGIMYWRRRSTIARRAAEEARSAGAGGRGSGKKGKDKDGKAKNKNKPKKVKRAEPGSYKPDLMRDSFTDYMRSAPQQFENGVAIAKAAMAAGSLDAAVTAADVAGGHAAAVAATTSAADAYPRVPQQQQQQQMMGVMGGSSNRPRMSGTLPPLPPIGGYPMPAPSAAATTATGLATVNTNDLIDLQNDVGVHRPSPVQQQPVAYPMHSMMYSGSVWGAAGGTGTTANSQISGGLSGGLLSNGLSSQMELMDAGASLALTSSLGLVSSVPQHADVALGVAEAQRYLDSTAAAAGQGGVQAENAALGVPGSAAGRNRSASSLRSIPAGGVVEGATSVGPLLLAGHASGDIEAGSATPTSSCCHDSVCTFRHGAGSPAGSQAGSRAGMPISTSSSWRSSTNMRSGGSGRALSSSGAASSGQGLGTALSGALSGALSRSSWSSAMSTDILLGPQHSAAVDP